MANAKVSAKDQGSPAMYRDATVRNFDLVKKIDEMFCLFDWS